MSGHSYVKEKSLESVNGGTERTGGWQTSTNGGKEHATRTVMRTPQPQPTCSGKDTGQLENGRRIRDGPRYDPSTGRFAPPDRDLEIGRKPRHERDTVPRQAVPGIKGDLRAAQGHTGKWLEQALERR